MKIFGLILQLLLILNINLLPNIIKTETKWVTDKNGKKIHKEEEKEFNAKGDLIKWVEYTDRMGAICQSYIYEYANGHKSKQIRNYCNSDKGRESTIYTYDELGRVIEEVVYDESDKVQRKTINHYIGNTNNLDFSVYGTKKIIFEYYPNNLLKKDVQTVAGSWFLTNEYKYDKDKHLIYHSSEADGGVGLIRYYFTYQNNVLVKDIVKVPGTGIEYHVYEYSYY